MKDDREIVNDWLYGQPADPKHWSKVKGGNKGGYSGRGPLFAAEGTIRLGYQGTPDKGMLLRSYDTFGLGYRPPCAPETLPKTVILNGDGSPSKMSSRHQRAVRNTVDLHIIQRALIPFSALDLAGLHVFELEILEVTPDRDIPREYWCSREHADYVVPSHGKRTRKGVEQHLHIRNEHFLGECLFKAKGRLYVCGLDRGDNATRRSFYLTRLPEGAKTRTVDTALKLLRPAGLSKLAVRQGEWFFDPQFNFKPTGEVFRESYVKGWWSDPKLITGVPCVSDQGKDLQEHLIQGHPFPLEREKRHVAPQMTFDGERVYVRGCVRDTHHAFLSLGNVWHLLIKNRADGSWSLDPTKHAQVD